MAHKTERLPECAKKLRNDDMDDGIDNGNDNSKKKWCDRFANANNANEWQDSVLMTEPKEWEKEYTVLP